MGTSTNPGTPVPVLSDPPNVPADMLRMAQFMDLVVQHKFADFSALTGAFPTPYNGQIALVNGAQYKGIDGVWRPYGKDSFGYWKNNGVNVPNSTNWGPENMALDSTHSVNAPASLSSPDHLTVNSYGLYGIAFTAVVQGTITTGRSFLELGFSNGMGGFRSSFQGEQSGFLSVPAVRLGSGTVLTFGFYQTSGAQRAVDFGVMVTRLG